MQKYLPGGCPMMATIWKAFLNGAKVQTNSMNEFITGKNN
jgi:hypothetical protein